MSGDESTNNARALAVLRDAIDEGVADLDAGRGEEMTVEELMADVRREVGLVASGAATS